MSQDKIADETKRLQERLAQLDRERDAAIAQFVRRVQQFGGGR